MLTFSNTAITSSVLLTVQNISYRSIQLTDVYLFNDDVAVPILDTPEILVPGKNLRYIYSNKL